MSMTTLENEIVGHLRRMLKNKKITKTWIQEWSTSKIEARDGETVYFIDEGLRVWAALRNPKSK